jgi:DNA polymerase-3 subunit alpha
MDSDSNKLQYANLHCRSTFSTGLAIGTSEDIINRARAANLAAVAVTDYSTLSGVLDFYKAGREAKFPTAIGTEVSYFDDHENSKDRYQNVVLLAKDQVGYENLCKLTSLSNQDDRRNGNPRLSIEDIREHREGLVCLSGNATGPFPMSLRRSGNTAAGVQIGLKRLSTLKEIFGEDFYIEIVLNDESFEKEEVEARRYQYVKRHTYNPQVTYNHLLLAAAAKLNVKPLISSDSYMPNKEDKILQDVVISNVLFGCPLPEARWIKSAEELYDLWRAGHPYLDRSTFSNLCRNSLEAAAKVCSIELKFSPQVVNYPHILHPLGKSGQTKLQLVLEIVRANGRVPLEDPVYANRLSYELKAICQNGKIDLIDYFLVLEDLCRWCRDNGIVVGPGRGSGAGSLLNYALRITHLDPIKYGLLFERFISEGRIQKGTLPDVDLDFSDQEAVRNYLVDKYGADRVKPIGVMQTLRLKNAVKDAFKALAPDLPFQIVNSVSTKLPKQDPEESEHEYYARCLEENATFADYMDKYPSVKDAVSRLIGFNRQPGIHPCGLAISQDPLYGFAPMRNLKDKWVLEFNADDSAYAGIIKYDILGLTTLKYFKTCLELIKQRHGIDLDIYTIPLDDTPTLRAFEKGDTESVFQFNSDVSRNILTKISVRGVDTLSLVTSVGRPGPMANGQHFEFIKRATNHEPPTPPHPSLDETLKDSYGIMIYQEGVMKASQILGGFTLAEADDVRKAMGKKKLEYIKPYKDRFVQYAIAHFPDIDQKRAEEIWQLMETFSGYGFNKSHSMSYALIGYICQYLKVHYKLEWWTACLTHATDTAHVAAYYKAAKAIIRLPDVNASTNEYYITDDGFIQMPFSVVKGVGDSANAEISSKRPFTSFQDFFERITKTKVNKKPFTQLIFAGAFDRLWPELGETEHKVAMVAEYYRLRGDKIPEDLQNLTRHKVLEKQNDALDFMVPNYYDIYEEAFAEDERKLFSEFKKIDKDQSFWVGGQITKIDKREIKKGENAGSFMWKLTVSNAGESIQVVVWPELARLYLPILNEGQVIKLKGRIGFYYDAVQMTALNILSIQNLIGGTVNE